MKLISMTSFVLVKSLGENYFINRKGQLYSKPRMGSKGGILKEQNGVSEQLICDIKKERIWKDII